MNTTRALQLEKNSDGDGYRILFNAMASSCEVIIQTSEKKLALRVAQTVATEVWRIEDKYSRYDPNSLCSKINNNAGVPVAIDQETFQLLTFADQCHHLSDGLFDISSGVLRQAWLFNEQSAAKASYDLNTSSEPSLPTPEQVTALMHNVGWHKIHFNHNQITLSKGMAIDFGGIGKEYAVDRSIILAKSLTKLPVLVNLGGDLAISCSRHNNKPWQVAIAPPDIDDTRVNAPSADMIVSLKSGALATSGDANRFLISKGKRYGHILNAKTGWPITNAPRSITVAAPQCIQAGILATLALLQGSNAEAFLTDQEIKFWARR